MKLDRTTYEIFLMDYLDGRLDAVEVSELLLFLEQNPDLKAEFSGIAGIKLVEDGQEKFNTSSLKKPVYADIHNDFDELIIAELEGDLSPQQEKDLNNAFALYPELKRVETVFNQTKLQPDLSVQFKNKSKLKVFVLQSYYKQISSIAAALLLFGFVWFYMNDQFSGNNSQTAFNGESQTENPNKENVVVNKPVEKSSIQNQQTNHSKAKVEKNKSKVQPIVIEVDEKKLTTQLEVAYIQPKVNSIIIEQQAVITPDRINGRVKMPAIVAEIEKEEYVDIKTWIVRKFRKEADLKNDEGLLAKINRATGADVVIEKDTTSGKISRFEIGGIGLVSR